MFILHSGLPGQDRSDCAQQMLQCIFFKSGEGCRRVLEVNVCSLAPIIILEGRRNNNDLHPCYLRVWLIMHIQKSFDYLCLMHSSTSDSITANECAMAPTYDGVFVLQHSSLPHRPGHISRAGKRRATCVHELAVAAVHCLCSLFR